jgi:hypothetical protein
MKSALVLLVAAEVLWDFELGIEWLRLAARVSVTGVASPQGDTVLAFLLLPH